MSDILRNELVLELVCGVCGTKLQIQLGSNKNKVTGNSASEGRAILAINPCAKCSKEAEELKRIIQKVVKLGQDQKGGEGMKCEVCGAEATCQYSCGKCVKFYDLCNSCFNKWCDEHCDHCPYCRGVEIKKEEVMKGMSIHKKFINRR